MFLTYAVSIVNRICFIIFLFDIIFAFFFIDFEFIDLS